MPRMAQSPFDFLMRCRKIEIFVYNLYVLNVGCYLKDLKPVLDTYSGYGCYLLKLLGGGGGGGQPPQVLWKIRERQQSCNLGSAGRHHGEDGKWGAPPTSFCLSSALSLLLVRICPLSSSGTVIHFRAFVLISSEHHQATAAHIFSLLLIPHSLYSYTNSDYRTLSLCLPRLGLSLLLTHCTPLQSASRSQVTMPFGQFVRLTMREAVLTLLWFISATTTLTTSHE